MGVSKVIFQVDGTTLGADTSSPYTYSWDTTQTSNANHTITATAYDAAGNQASASVTVTVSNGTTSTSTASSTVLFQDGFESGTLPGAWDEYSSSDVTINANSTYVHSGNYSLQIHYNVCGGPIPSPSDYMTYNQVAGGSLATTTYYSLYTYVTTLSMESWPNADSGGLSNYSAHTVPSGYLLQVNSPSDPSKWSSPWIGMAGYNVYVGTATSSLTKQNTTPIPFGTPWVEPVSGLVAGGATPPAINSVCGQDHQDRNRYVDKNFNSTNGYPNGLGHAFVGGWVYLQSPQPDGVVNTGYVARKLFYLKSPGTSGREHDFAVVVSVYTDMKLAIGTDDPYSSLTPIVKYGLAPIALDAWHYLEAEVQLNTPGASDGILRVWFDGALVYENTAANIRGTLTEGLVRFEIGRQADRNYYVPIDEYRYWDDITIGTSYISP